MVYVKKAIGILVIDMNHIYDCIALIKLLARYLPLKWRAPRRDVHHMRFLMDPHPRDSGIDSVVPLVVFRVHAFGPFTTREYSTDARGRHIFTYFHARAVRPR